MRDCTGEQIGNYRLLRLLGGGGSADVYLGEHLHLKTQVAVKILHNRLRNVDIEDFKREARTIASLKHPHITRVLDFGFDGPTPFLVMDYAPLGTLRDRHPRGTLILLPEVVAYVKQVASALDYAHTQAKIIHRDVKPENMLLADEHTVLLSDFGIASLAHNTSSMKRTDSSGTPYYMAPEQIEQKPRLASDQYALGVVVYEWLCGEWPFNGDHFIAICMQHLNAPIPSLCDKNPEISRDVELVVQVALAKAPQQRFTTIQAFAVALEQASNIGSVPTILHLTESVNQSAIEAEMIHGQDHADVVEMQAVSLNDTRDLIDEEQDRPLVRSGQQDDERTRSLSAESVLTMEPESPVKTIPPTPEPLLSPPASTPAPVFRSAPTSGRNSRRAGIFWRVVLLGLLLVGLLLGSGTLYYLMNQSHLPQHPGHQIVGSSTNTTTTTGPRTTTTATATTTSATSTTNATTPTAGSSHAGSSGSTPPSRSPSIIPSGWKEVLNESMTSGSPQGAWESDSTCTFTPNGYDVEIPGSGYCTNGNSTNNGFSDLAYSADLSILQGNEAGIVFRKTANSYYYFSINTSGEYRFIAYANGGDENVLAQATSGAIHTGNNQWNTVQIVAQGTSIKLYINGQFITPAHDATRTFGDIALGVQGPDASSTSANVLFKNVAVWTP